MAHFHVLIVDDHREIRVSYRANLEVLSEEIRVIDVPSGEEALLEARLNPVDVLITDIKLAGISGLELLEKMKAIHPEIRVILVTGLVDVEIRREVAQAGADAFFLKPVDVRELQETVLQLLSLREDQSNEVPGREEQPSGEAAESIPERIQHLRRVLDAYLVILVDERGKIIARSGSFPDHTDSARLLPDLIGTFKIMNAVSSHLGKPHPEDLWYFSGTHFDMYWGHVGKSHGILVAAKPFRDDYGIARHLRVVLEAEWGLEWYLEDHETLPDSPPRGENDLEYHSAHTPTDKDDQNLLGIIRDRQGVSPETVDQFWDNAVQEKFGASLNNQDAISYEKARQLGLTPEGME